MKHYAFRVYKENFLNVIYGGTVSAETMDGATKSIMERNNIKSILKLDGFGRAETEFMMDTQKVTIIIWANPEDY